MAVAAASSSSRSRRAASRNSFLPGYYKALHSQTAADCFTASREDDRSSRRLSLPEVSGPAGSEAELPPGCYFVERVIAARKYKGNNEYLVLWEGYPKEEASWVGEEDVTTAAIRSFESPGLPYRVLADASSHLIAAIQNSLKSGVNRNNRLDIEFRTDVFRVLFNGKGRNPPKGRGLFYDKNDFDTTYFKDDWYVAYDKLGDGCSIDFPVRLESKIRWSPKVFNADGILKSRIFSEIICVTLVKVRI